MGEIKLTKLILVVIDAQQNAPIMWQCFALFAGVTYGYTITLVLCFLVAVFY